MGERERSGGGSEQEVCSKCGQEIQGDWEDDYPEPLCFGCSHGQNRIERERYQDTDNDQEATDE